MADTNAVARTLHDVGLAAWFGGSLMGAIGVNGAASEVDDARQRARVANAGWARWTPVNLAAIGAHLAGGAMLTAANKGRIAGQQGVASTATAKGVLTGVTLGATAYARALGRKMKKAGDVPVEGGTDPSASTPPNVAGAQRKLATLQWLIPALTAGLLAMNSYMGEQQRPQEVASGFLSRLFGGRS
jgi:hypothetical protein